MLRRLFARVRGSKPPELSLDVIPDHESGVRRMVADAEGGSYEALHTLDEAQRDPLGCVVLEGDWGGQIYTAAPARLVRCDEAALSQLLRYLDGIAWPSNELDGARVFYERRAVGSPIVGGMGGAVVAEEIWVHQEFVDLRIDVAVREVIRGERDDIPTPAPWAH
jgi:hypothetical protein